MIVSRLSLVVFVLSCASCHCLSAATITLLTDITSTSPAEVDAGDTSSIVTVSITNADTNDTASNFLSGWQVLLQLLPESGATGTVSFNTTLAGTGSDEPSNYIFSTISNLGIFANNTGSALLAFDFNLPFSGGVQVPSGAGANLFAFAIDASIDADGLFGIYAIPASPNTLWTDSTSPIQQSRGFANVALTATSPVKIGEISVTPIPEPSTLVLGCMLATTYLGFRSRRRNQAIA